MAEAFAVDEQAAEAAFEDEAEVIEGDVGEGGEAGADAAARCVEAAVEVEVDAAAEAGGEGGQAPV